MAISLKTRMLAALVATLLALGSSMSAARADEEPHVGPLNAPSPTTDSGHEHGEEVPPMARQMAGGSIREYSDGDKLTYRLNVTQTLQPNGPQQAEARRGSMELVLTETVTVDDDGPLVTLEVTEASAEGFLAEAEERSALERKVQFRPRADRIDLVLKGGDQPDLTDPEVVRPFGDIGALRMADLALWSHLLNPVVPSDDINVGGSVPDTAELPMGWALGFQSIDGSITVEGSDTRDGRDVMKVSGVHIANQTLLRVRAMDNAVVALQGKEKPVPNEFFAGTLFDALFPKGSTYESLMPQLPGRPVAEQRRRRMPPPRNRWRRRSGWLLLGLLAILTMGACSDPSKNEAIVSLNALGPVQINHQSAVDEATGVLLSSNVDASAKLVGNVHRIPEEIMEGLPQPVRDVSGVEFGIDANWTVAETLVSAIPERTSTAPWALIIGGAALLALALIVFLRRRKGAGPTPPGGPEESPAEPEPVPVERTT